MNIEQIVEKHGPIVASSEEYIVAFGEENFHVFKQDVAGDWYEYETFSAQSQLGFVAQMDDIFVGDVMQIGLDIIDNIS